MINRIWITGDKIDNRMIKLNISEYNDVLFKKILEIADGGEGIINGISVRCAHTDQELTRLVEELNVRGIKPTVTGHTLTWREPIEPGIDEDTG